MAQSIIVHIKSGSSYHPAAAGVAPVPKPILLMVDTIDHVVDHAGAFCLAPTVGRVEVPGLRQT